MGIITNHSEDPYLKKPGFNGKVTGFFFGGSHFLRELPERESSIPAQRFVVAQYFSSMLLRIHEDTLPETNSKRT